MHPLAGLLIPAATRGNAVQMRIVLPIAAMRLDDHDVAAFEGAATDTAEAIIQALHSTAYERTQYNLRLLIKCLASITAPATLGFSRWTQRRGRQLHCVQNRRKH